MKEGDIVYVKYRDHCTIQGFHPNDAKGLPMFYLYAYGKIIKIEEKRILVEAAGQEPDKPAPRYNSILCWILRGDIEDLKFLDERSVVAMEKELALESMAKSLNIEAHGPNPPE